MGMLPARHYVSEHTKFITEVLAQKPQLVDEQKKGRAMWWDKSPRDLDARSEQFSLFYGVLNSLKPQPQS